MISNKTKYLAFISYCHDNKKQAKRLQTALEGYNIPIQLLEEHPDIPKQVRPIFRDETDLPAGGVLDERIKEALRSSRKLVYIATPEAARRYWPGQEIEFFAKLDVSEKNPSGRVHDIIPVVLDGIPCCGIPYKECYPETLREITNKTDIYAINLTDYSYDLAVSKIVAELLGVDPDVLWQRQIRVQRKRRKKRLVFGVCLTLLFLVLCMALAKVTRTLSIQRIRQISETATTLVEKGDGFTARRLLLEAIPWHKRSSLGKHPELAWALFQAMNAQKGQIHVPEPIAATAETDSGTLLTISVFSPTRTAFLREWDLRTGIPFHEHSFEFSHGSQRTMDFYISPDRTKILTSDGRLLDTDTFTPNLELEKVMYELSGAVFSPDMSVIAACENRDLVLWDVETGKQIIRVDDVFKRGRLHFRPDSIIFSMDASTLAFTPAEGGVGVMRLKEMGHVNVIPAGDSATVRSTGPIPRYTAFIGDRLVGLNNDGYLLWTEKDDGTTTVWDTERIKSFGNYPPPIEMNNPLVKGEKEISHSIDQNTVSVCLSPEVAQPILIHTQNKWNIDDYNDEIVSADTSRNGRFRAIVGYDERVLRIYDNRNGRLISDTDTLDSVGQLEFSPDSRKLLSFGQDEIIYIFNPRTGSLTANWDNYEGEDVIFNPRKKLLASSNYHGNVFVWNYRGKVKASFDIKNNESINDIRFSPDGKSLACCTDRGSVIIWDINSKKETMMTTVEDEAGDIFFSPEGTLLAVFSSGGHLQLLDPKTGDKLWSFQFPEAPYYYGAEFSEDVSSLYVFSEDTAWQLNLPDFDTLTDELMQVYKCWPLTKNEIDSLIK